MDSSRGIPASARARAIGALPSRSTGTALTSRPARSRKATHSRLGHIKMVLHQPLTGIPNPATVKRTPTGKWFVWISVVTEQDAGSLAPSEGRSALMSVSKRLPISRPVNRSTIRASSGRKNGPYPVPIASSPKRTRGRSNGKNGARWWRRA